MKPILILLCTWMTLCIVAQNQVTISVTDPYTFDRIAGANLLLEDSDGNLKLYETDRNGLIFLNNIQGKVRISSY